ncbi:MAG: hypothetical protein CME62_10135 [Halobacteriovoraceae bacterium]|nr:hypothetical protein [Halobacteriovoraceae bacterium]
MLINFSSAFASKGLGVNFYTRYLKYEHKPAKRIKIRTKGDMLNYRDRVFDRLRDKISPLLEHFSKISKHSQTQGFPIENFNPHLPVHFIDENNLKKLAGLVYPTNLAFLLKREGEKDIETITFSLKSVPSREHIQNFMTSLGQVFDLGLRAEKLSKKLSAAEKEMLQVIRKKEIHFQKIHTYFGLQLKHTVFVEANYFKELNKSYEDLFVKLQKDFKFYFYQNKKIELAIKNEQMQNLEKVIEKNNFKDLKQPFKLNPNVEVLKSIEKSEDEYTMTYLFAFDKNQSSLKNEINSVIKKASP